jgi:L-fuconolactonase
MNAAGLVDAHVHVWDPAVVEPRDEIAEAGAVDALLSTFDQAGVARGVVVQPSVHGSDHAYLLGALDGADGLLAGVCLAEPEDPGWLEVLESLASSRRIRGVRMPLIRAPEGWLDRAGDPIFELARRAGWVVGPFLRPEQLAGLRPFLERFPDVPVVIDHLARIDVLGDRRADGLAELCTLAAYPQVAVKASALPAVSAGLDEIRTVLEGYGPERVLWGSDYPPTLQHGPYGDGLRMLRVALRDEPPETVAAVLGGNAARLYLDPRSEK